MIKATPHVRPRFFMAPWLVLVLLAWASTACAAGDPLHTELVKARRACETDRVLSVSVCGHREGKNARIAHAFVLEGDTWKMLAEATWQRFRGNHETGTAQIALRQFVHAQREYIAARELPPNRYTSEDSPPPGPVPEGWPAQWHDEPAVAKGPLTSRDPVPSRAPYPRTFLPDIPFDNPVPRGLMALPELWNRHDVVPVPDHGRDRGWARDPFPRWP